MARKIKVKKPPLSAIDKFIYVLVGFSSIVLMVLVLMLFAQTIPNKVAFSDESVVARYGLAGLYSAIPMVMFVTFTPGLLAYKGWEEKQPIIGNKKYKPKFNESVLKTFPLFSRAFRENLKEHQKKTIKKTAFVVLIIFLICASILPFGIFPRTVIDDQNVITHYNVFNQITHEASIEEADRLVIRISSHKGRRTPRSYGIKLEFVYGKESYYLNLGGFGDMEREDVLRYMLSLKDYFKDGRYEILSTEWMDRLIDDKNFTATEQKLVYDLFDYTP